VWTEKTSALKFSCDFPDDRTFATDANLLRMSQPMLAKHVLPFPIKEIERILPGFPDQVIDLVPG
jgi:hypothetical protein